MPYALVVPVFNPTVRKICARPYEGHPRGCPNFGVASRCPPRAPLLYDVFDQAGPFYAVWSTFPLSQHVESMQQRHPDWSPRQLGCVLYWQGTARKRLRAVVAEFRAEVPGRDWLVETTPEAFGLDVTATMLSIGVTLPWPPVDVAYHVALAGLSKGG